MGWLAGLVNRSGFAAALACRRAAAQRTCPRPCRLTPAAPPPPPPPLAGPGAGERRAVRAALPGPQVRIPRRGRAGAAGGSGQCHLPFPAAHLPGACVGACGAALRVEWRWGVGCVAGGATPVMLVHGPAPCCKEHLPRKEAGGAALRRARLRRWLGRARCACVCCLCCRLRFLRCLHGAEPPLGPPLRRRRWRCRLPPLAPAPRDETSTQGSTIRPACGHADALQSPIAPPARCCRSCARVQRAPASQPACIAPLCTLRRPHRAGRATLRVAAAQPSTAQHLPHPLAPSSPTDAAGHGLLLPRARRAAQAGLQDLLVRRWWRWWGGGCTTSSSGAPQPGWRLPQCRAERARQMTWSHGSRNQHPSSASFENDQCTSTSGDTHTHSHSHTHTHAAGLPPTCPSPPSSTSPSSSAAG